MRKRQPWRNELELARGIYARAERGRDVWLSNETARFVALKMMTAGAKPTRDAVAKMICHRKCEGDPCFDCKGRANIVCRAYGQSIAVEEKPFEEMTPKERQAVIDRTINRR